jgi:hypothetical protein
LIFAHHPVWGVSGVIEKTYIDIIIKKYKPAGTSS